MKKIMIAIMAICMVLGFRTVFAGTCGVNVAYTISGNTITFSKGPAGADPIWGSDCGEAFKSNSEITAVNIADPIRVLVAKDMFRDSRFAEQMDLKNLDVSGATDMSGMFYGCRKLTGLDVSGWDTSHMTDMSSVFYKCSGLKSLDGIGSWDTSVVADVNRMFYGCHSLTGLDVSGWKTGSFMDMESVFEDCDSLRFIRLGKNTISEDNFFKSLPNYAGPWYYLKPGAEAGDPLPLKTGKKGSALFEKYAFNTMAGIWTSDGSYDLTESVVIRNSAGKDITGQSVTADTADYQLLSGAVPAGAVQDAAWFSSDYETAAVTRDGLVTFRKAGTVTITAGSPDLSEKTASVTLSSRPEAVSLIITDSKGTDITGKTVISDDVTCKLNAEASPADAAQTVTWKSSSTNSAEVDADGSVTFKSVGTVTITAASTDWGRAAASVQLTLLPVADSLMVTNADGTDVTGKALTVRTGNYQLSASASPANVVRTVVWKSSDDAIAAVDADGMVTFNTTGTVKITAVSKDRGKASGSVELTLPPEASAITITDAGGTDITGKTLKAGTVNYQLKAGISPANAEQTVTWKSSDDAIAVVDAEGMVTFNKPGSVIINAASGDKGNVSGSVELMLLPKASAR